MKLRNVRKMQVAGVSLAAMFLALFSGSGLPSLADDAKSQDAKTGSAKSAEANLKEAKPAEAKKIPAVPVEEVEIKELKVTLAVDVLAQHSKVFKTKQKITRVAVSDPSVADVILMTENQFVVIGKNPGAISVTIWCEPSKNGAL